MFPRAIILEKDYDSLTISWGKNYMFALDITNPRPPATYELQMSEDSGEWVSLSTSLSTNIIKKKNLTTLHQYTFKYRSSCDGINMDWSTPSVPTTVLDRTVKQMTPPVMLSRDTGSIALKWDEIPDNNDGYRLRYRVDSDITWHNIDTIIKGITVKKKGLKSGVSYYFSIKPNNDAYEWSCSSSKLTVTTYSPWMINNISSQLLSKNGLISSSDAIGGKVIAIYFSASWCGPCRNFTPQLVSLHNATRSKPFEIIFVSCDHSNEDFMAYYNGHHGNWLAVPYDDAKREQLQAIFKVTGIPRLAVLTSAGRLLVDNAVGMQLTPTLVDSWIAQNEN